VAEEFFHFVLDATQRYGSMSGKFSPVLARQDLAGTIREHI
jgi:hypothetical protein